MAIQLPIGSEDSFCGIIDLVEMNAVIYEDDLGTKREIVEIPADMKDEAEQYHELLISGLAELDEALMEKYLEGIQPGVEEVKAAIRRLTVTNQIIPVLCGSAFKNKGVQLLLDAVVQYLPSPLDLPDTPGKTPDGQEVVRAAKDDAPFTALAFKIMTDPFVGKLTYIRVYSGVLNTGSYIYNVSKQKRERVGRILRMHANHREDIETLYAGDIAAIVGFKESTTGDTLADEKNQILMEAIEIPETDISIAIEPKPRPTRITAASLIKLAEETNFPGQSDQETGRQSSRVWASCTLRLLLTDSCANFAWKPMLENPRWRTEKLFVRLLKLKVNSSGNPVAADNTGMLFLRLNPVRLAQALNSSIVLLAA